MDVSSTSKSDGGERLQSEQYVPDAFIQRSTNKKKKKTSAIFGVPEGQETGLGTRSKGQDVYKGGAKKEGNGTRRVWYTYKKLLGGVHKKRRKGG